MVRKSNTKILSSYPNKVYCFTCEDKASMCHYLNGLKPYLKQNIKIEVHHSKGETAKQVYDNAENKYNKLKLDENAYPKGFEVVACFDKDDNKINDIYDIMKSKKVSVIYNNPCYEYWLYLHTKKNKPVFASSQDCANKCLKEINSKYKPKHFKDTAELKSAKNIFEIVKNDYTTAVNNAESFNFSDYNNTYTNMHEILNKIVDNDKI